MAYCVHCGVKLGSGEARCPLCNTISIDPHEQKQQEKQAPLYPTRTQEQLLQRSKRYFLALFGILLLVPALLCLMIDLLIGGSVSWSIYAFTALVLLYISIAVPIWVDRYKAYFSIITSYICLMLYLKMVEEVSGSGHWFFPIVLPCVTVFIVLTLLITHLYKRNVLGKFTLFGAILAEIAVLCVIIELLISLYLDKAPFVWSQYAFAPCLFISLLIFFINSNQTIREEIRRRTHF